MILNLECAQKREANDITSVSSKRNRNINLHETCIHSGYPNIFIIKHANKVVRIQHGPTMDLTLLDTVTPECGGPRVSTSRLERARLGATAYEWTVHRSSDKFQEAFKNTDVSPLLSEVSNYSRSKIICIPITHEW